MDLTKELPFKVGDEIKNYKEMCRLLGEKQRAGNSKKSQFSRWSKYFKWEKIGHRFKITEITEEKFPTHDNNRVGFQLKEYNEFIQKLILHMLQQYSELHKGSHLLISNKGIILFLGIFNTAFFELNYDKKQREEFANEHDIKEKFMRLFFQRMNSTMHGDINSALKQLQLKGLIYVTEVQIAKPTQTFQSGMVARDYVYLEEFLNEYGLNDIATEFLENYGVVSQKEYNKQMQLQASENGLPARVTTPFEKSVILLLQQITIEEMKSNSIRHIWMQNRFNEYLTRFQSKLKNYLGIAYVYKGYGIVFSKPVLETVDTISDFGITNEQEQKLKGLLKNAFNEGIIENLLNFHEKSKQTYENSLGFINTENFDNDSIESSEVCFIDALTDNEKTVLGTESLNKVIQKILYEVTR